MQYLHTMIRVANIEATKHFFCDGLGLVEISRYDNEGGRFTLVFLAAPDDESRANSDDKAPMLELTYNWPDENGEGETYSVVVILVTSLSASRTFTKPVSISRIWGSP